VARVTGALKPADILEEMWVRDIVDLIWDQLRLRHYKAGLLTDCAREGVEFEVWDRELDPMRKEARELERKWAGRDGEARATVTAKLAASGNSLEGITARVMLRGMSHFERIERLIRGAEGRRHTALHELQRHRESRAERQRRAALAGNVEDAEFQVIARKPPAQAGAP
jgi:hypothetical protein